MINQSVTNTLFAPEHSPSLQNCPSAQASTPLAHMQRLFTESHISPFMSPTQDNALPQKQSPVIFSLVSPA